MSSSSSSAAGSGGGSASPIRSPRRWPRIALGRLPEGRGYGVLKSWPSSAATTEGSNHDPAFLASSALSSYSAVPCSCWEKNSSAFLVFVSCSPERSIPCPVRKALVSAAIWKASEGAHFVDSSRSIELSG